MSAQSVALLTLSLALSGNAAAHRFVTPAGAQADADDNTLGVARTAGTTGETIPVDVLGTAVVEAGADFAAGATLKADADGKAIPWDTSGAKVAIALQAAGAAGDLVEVLLIPNVA
jgi:hypothetical protein